ncbi:Hypothetical_protein [Hexamita inflata]|uniref:Hypothetical_protein n=1 Tax=Hexamita inflata TaxID=28002 RepID=A0AA86QSB1_9EUKA|nr:Hypothetical protein HINF_LOCUS12561 [Hexamita inflata]CAI9960636.1 Hypothetical protein HINF_LOCUS48281 [Hexamita inflata]
MSVVKNIFGVLIITYLLLIALASACYYSLIQKRQKISNDIFFLVIEYLASSLFIILGCFIESDWRITNLLFWVIFRVASCTYYYCSAQELISLSYLQPKNMHKYKQNLLFDNTSQGIDNINKTIKSSFSPKIGCKYDAFHYVSRECEYYDYSRAEQIMRVEQFLHDPKKGPLVCVVAPELVKCTVDKKVASSSGEYNIQILGYSEIYDQLIVQEDESVFTVVTVSTGFKWLGDSEISIISLNKYLENKISRLDTNYNFKATTTVKDYKEEFVIFNRDLYQTIYSEAQQNVPKWIKCKFIKLYWMFAFIFQLEVLFTCYLHYSSPFVEENLRERSIQLNMNFQLSLDPKVSTDKVLYELNEQEDMTNLCSKNPSVVPYLTKDPIIYFCKSKTVKNAKVTETKVIEPDSTELIGSKETYTNYV